jgi:hypothetical protein
MKITTFAPHLAGRMLPAMFAYLSIGIKERFPGDPYAHQEPWAAFFWMHTTACMQHEHVYGRGWGLERSWTIPAALREPRQAESAPAPAPKPEKRVLYTLPKSAAVQCEMFAGVHA